MKAWVIKDRDGYYYTADQDDDFQGPLNSAKLFTTEDEAAELCDYYGDEVIEVEINIVEKGG